MKKIILGHKNIVFPVVTVLFSLVVTILLAEITLRYFENKFLYITADLNQVVTQDLQEGGFLKKNFNDHVVDSFGNEIRWVNNSDGFRNFNEFSKKPDNGTLRILSLGDSFTAGYRIDQKKTFSFLIEEWLGKTFGKTEVLIAWTEQPGLALKYMKKFGKNYYPDIVFLGITIANDLTQSYSEKKGISYYNDLHSWEVADKCLVKRKLFEEVKWMANFIYSRLRFVGLFYDPPRAVSSRHKAYRKPKLFDTHHALGFFLNPSPSIIEDAYSNLFLNIFDLKKYLDKLKINLVVSIFPQRFQISKRDWEMFVYEYGLDESCFDLLYPNKLFKQFCDENKIFCVDGTQNMKKLYSKNKLQLYQPRGDTHWNALGNQVFFESIEPSLSRYFEKSRDKIWPISHQPN